MRSARIAGSSTTDSPRTPHYSAAARAARSSRRPSELERPLSRPDLLASGISARDAVGLASGVDVVEAFAPTGHRDALIDEHALLPGDGAVQLRWVPDEL